MIRTITSVLFVITVAVAAPAHSAAYMKFDGVDGDSKSKSTSAPSKLKTSKAPTPGTPALKKIKNEPKGTDGAKGGKVEFEWKVEEGEN